MWSCVSGLLVGHLGVLNVLYIDARITVRIGFIVGSEVARTPI